MIGAVSTPSPAPASRPVKVTAFLDASEEVVEPFGAKRVDSLEKARADAPQLEATACLYRSGATPGHKMVKGLAMLGANIAVPVVGGLVGGPVGLAVGLAAGAFLFFGGLGRQGIGEIESARLQRSQLPDPDWQGRRTYEIAADKTDGFDSAVTSDEPQEVKPAYGDFSELLRSSMDPSKTNVVYLMGHGLGYRQAASMPVSEVRDSLQDAARRTGAKADVLVMESCLMGNMEALNELSSSATVAVVSEETLSVDAMPVREMMADAAKNGGTPQEIGRRMVEIAAHEKGIDTLAAIDLTRMPALMSSLDTLGKSLAADVQAGHGKEIKDAVKHAMKYPQGKMMFLDRAMIKFSDLGNFLDQIPDLPVSSASAAAARTARQAMKDAVIAGMTGDGYGRSSGMSFQTSAAGMTSALDRSPEMGHYGDLHLPGGWRDFIHALDQKQA
jgi:hypothetical protein